MSVPKISESSGELELAGRKDAFHVPGVLAQLAGPSAVPGSYVKFTDEGMTKVRPWYSSLEAHGIIDPFLPEAPATGEVFWVFLLPGMVKDLTHSFKVSLPVAAVAAVEKIKESSSENDGSCKGCYGDDEEDDEDDACKGCYD